MADPTLYLFDGYNLLHAGSFADRDELVDTLASFVAGRGVRGVVVFDGVGDERSIGPLQIRFTAHADDLLERLAAENRDSESSASCPPTTPSAVTSGQEVRKLASKAFLADLQPVEHVDHEQHAVPAAGSAIASTRRRASASSAPSGRIAREPPAPIPGRTYVLSILHFSQTPCNACAMVLGSPSTSR